MGDRYVARQQARSSVTRTRFQDSWDRLRKEIQKDENAIRSKELRTSEDNEQLAELAQRLEKLDAEMAKKRQDLEAGTWSELEITARDSEANNKLWAYWRALFFVFGAMVLSLGLLAVGFTSQGPERWVCLVMLAVITYSLFVGGKNW